MTFDRDHLGLCDYRQEFARQLRFRGLSACRFSCMAPISAPVSSGVGDGGHW